MNLSYKCHGYKDMKPKMWTGHITLLSHVPPYEMEVNARGSYFHILFGLHEYGHYLCIPNWNIGMELSGLTDRFWNFERLVNTHPNLSEVDAISITDSLAAVADYLNI